MRSHSSSHRSSHRSSFSRSHRSGISRSHSHSSINRNSLRHGSIHKSGMHRTSLGSRIHKSKIGGASISRSPFRRHGISNAHAFAVGKATGVNINGSPMAAHGAALHRAKKIRERSHFTGSSRHGVSSILNRNTRIHNKYKSSSNFLKRMRVSHSKHRYTSKKTNYSKIQGMGQEVNVAMNEFAKYAWIPFLIIFILLFFGAAFMMVFFLAIMRNIVF